MSKKYKARNGYRVTNDQAQKIGEVVEGLETRTAHAMLKEASKKRNPIHDLFDWNDESAANKQRLAHARYLMASIELVIEQKEPVKAFHCIQIETQNDEPGEYRHHEEVIHTGSDLQYLSDTFYREIVHRCKKAQDLGLTGMNEEWDHIVNEVMAFKPGHIGPVVKRGKKFKAG